MTNEEYIKSVLKTETKDFRGIADRITLVNSIRLVHSSMGICTEAGELQDAIKKHIFYGKELDTVNIKEELGDLLYYIALAMDVLGISFEEVQKKNIEKLSKRYKNGFSTTDAINRDLETERKTLEGEDE